MGSVAACIITLVLGFLHVLGAESTFAVQVFWSDPACTQYAGTFSTALNGCFAEFDSDTQQISYVILNTTNTNGIYNMKAYHYTDSICSEFIDSTSMNFPGSCTAYGSGGYTTLVMTTSMPTEFPVDGSFSTMYQASTGCGGTSVVMGSLHVPYNNGLCMGLYNQQFGQARSCSKSKTGFSTTTDNMCNNLPNATTTTVSNGACYTDQYFSWGGYYGSVQYQCYGAYTTDDDSGDDGLSDLELGAIVGGCVGGVGLIAGAIFAWFYCKPSATPPLASSAV